MPAAPPSPRRRTATGKTGQRGRRSYDEHPETTITRRHSRSTLVQQSASHPWHAAYFLLPATRSESRTPYPFTTRYRQSCFRHPWLQQRPSMGRAGLPFAIHGCGQAGLVARRRFAWCHRKRCFAVHRSGIHAAAPRNIGSAAGVHALSSAPLRGVCILHRNASRPWLAVEPAAETHRAKIPRPSMATAGGRGPSPGPPTLFSVPKQQATLRTRETRRPNYRRRRFADHTTNPVAAILTTKAEKTR